MLAMLLVLLSAPAQATNGAGGLVVHAISLEREAPDAPGPGPMQCVGAVGFGVRDSGMRLGGEAHGCTGPYGELGFGGLHLGKQRHYGKRIYAGWTAGVGLGGMSVEDCDERTASSTFGYLRPGVHAGLPLGFTAVEVGAYAMVPLVHLYEARVNDVERSNLFHVGLQASFLFGNMRRHRPEPPVVRAPERPDVVVVVGGAPHPERDDRPLAITEPDHPDPLE